MHESRRKVKRSYKAMLIILGIVLAVIGIIVTAIGMKAGIDSVLLEGAPKETVEKNEFDEMTEFVDGNFRLSESYDGSYDKTTLDEIYTSIHTMSHSIVIAEEKWGKKAMTEENINTACNYSSTSVEDSAKGAKRAIANPFCMEIWRLH